ncbi:MAG: ABC transporter ATP-binding protein [Cytophagales bacterium]|nr:MAG: ABC transporter ATP-binding protein [Cytophagales bacterium]TAF62307.1 MAG: ABC transporter ATP-binding protein [Cytophagales bacterium]
MNVLSAEFISKAFSEKWLFQNISFGVSQGEKVGLVGINGAGKSTFLKILAGLIQPDTGSVSVRKGTKVVYLDQQPDFEHQETVWDSIFKDPSPLMTTIKRYQALSEQGNASQHELQEVLEAMEKHQAWNYESQIKETLSKLGIHDLTLRTHTLSGGQRKRIALARALLAQPDVLILDEPTNHLDLDVIEWLEDFLSTSTLTVILITHDRYFLDKVTNQIMELDEGKIFRYNGKYDYFLEQKVSRRIQQEVELEKAQNLMRKELDWIRRQPQARGTKAKYRVEAFEGIKEKASQKGNTQSIQINLQTSRQGKKILELANITKSFEQKKILHHFTYIFRRGERIGIVGRNGVGKTTLLKILTGQTRPDSGSIEKGENTVFGYYTQEHDTFEGAKKVIDVVKDVAEVIKTESGSIITASQLLTLFLFPPNKQYDEVQKLSGGERRRLQLLKILMLNPNFLILDEPTNDLDIVTLNVLEEYLMSFGGCLLVVSHDRYFMDKVTDHLFVFDGDGVVKDFPGNYSDYKDYLLEKKQAAAQEAAAVKAAAALANSEKPQKERTKAKLSFKEQKEYETLDKQLPELEKNKADLELLLTQQTDDYQKIKDISDKIKQISEEIDEKSMRWLELSEYL